MTHQTSDIRPPTLLHRLAVLLVLATFVLIVLGGNVTSKGVGMSVPDGFTVYGHFLWTFPVEKWVGGVFDEHVHRLKGSVVGLITLALCVGVLWKEPRRYVRHLALALFGLVVVQGIFGGLRVDANSVPLAIVHGVVAQVFFCLTVLVAACTGRWWIDAEKRGELRDFLRLTNPLRLATLTLLAALFAQLILGAVMRHTKSGLAIPDFPTSYGQLVPPLSEPGIRAAVDERPYESFTHYYQPWQVGVHFAHRLGAVALVAVMVWTLVLLNPILREERSLLLPTVMVGGLMLLQLALGAMVIWTGKHAHVATAHQANGALILGAATLLAVRVRLLGNTPLTSAKPRAAWGVA